MRGVVVGLAAAGLLLVGAGGAAAAGTPVQHRYGPFPTKQACDEQRASMYDTTQCTYTSASGLPREGWYFYAPLQPV